MGNSHANSHHELNVKILYFPTFCTSPALSPLSRGVSPTLSPSGGEWLSLLHGLFSVCFVRWIYLHSAYHYVNKNLKSVHTSSFVDATVHVTDSPVQLISLVSSFSNSTITNTSVHVNIVYSADPFLELVIKLPWTYSQAAGIAAASDRFGHKREHCKNNPAATYFSLKCNKEAFGAHTLYCVIS